MKMTIDNVQQGWQCPICKRVYSPLTMMCLYCGEEGATKYMFDWDKENTDVNPTTRT